MSVFIKQEHTIGGFKDSDSWVILSPIERSIKQKIESIGTSLKYWDIEIYRGILTGYNEAFIISGEQRTKILNNCTSADERKRTEELIRPILRGRDIKRYSYHWANLWLIWIPWHFPLHLDNTIQGASEKAEKEFKKHYTAVYNHLIKFKAQLSARNKAETGIRYEWYALQRWGANYWEDFSKPKILYQELTQGSSFFYDDSCNFLVSNTGYLITGQHLDYLIKLLNSKLIEVVYSKFYATKIGSGIRWLSQNIKQLPLPIYNASYVTKITSATTDEEVEFELYRILHLSEEEIQYFKEA